MEAIGRIAVLGAGTMGARMAALFAASGVPVFLLDITEEMAQRGLDRAGAGPLVTPGSFTDGIPLLRGFDWIFEAVREDLSVKQDLWRRVAPCLSPGSIASTNTSGLSIASISEAFPETARGQFLGVHFFNPPGKLHLVEVIRTAHTDPEIAAAAIEFVSARLGKGVLEARDTPNFIANRIGAFFSAAAQCLATEENLPIEEIDRLTGLLIGMPKSGTYRLMDIIGLDIWSRILESLDLPRQPYISEMLTRGWLGDKSGGGFYRRTSSQAIEALDLCTMQYRPAILPIFDGENHPPLPKRLHQLLAQQDQTAAFLNRLFDDLIRYSHQVAPLIANLPTDLDLAMRWGYGWSLGPFEIESAIR